MPFWFLGEIRQRRIKIRRNEMDIVDGMDKVDEEQKSPFRFLGETDDGG
jgi:hypothetical protein